MLIDILKPIRILFLAGSILYALVILFKHLILYNQGRQYTLDEVIDEKRMSFLQKILLFHHRMMRDPAAHLYHTLIMVGFLLSIAGHMFRPLCLAGAGLMGFGSGMALIRRLWSHDPRLKLKFDKVITLVCLFLIAITGVMSYLKVFMPNMADTTILIFVTLHSFSISGMLIIFAKTRLIHIMTASMQLNAKADLNPPGVFNGTDDTVKQVAKVVSGEDANNIVSEDNFQFGFVGIHDLDSKNRLEVDACTECGRCDAICPAANTGKLLSPKKFTVRLRQTMEKNARPKTTDFDADEILKEMTWQCSMCYSCESACPVLIDRVNTIANIRRNLILEKGEAPEDYIKVIKNLKKSNNIWGYSESARLNMDPQLTKGGNQQADLTIWLGCFYLYDSNMQRIVKSLLLLLEKANIKYDFINQEMCCGDYARRIGDEYLFQEQVHKNIRQLADQGIRNLLTLCPHCTNSLRNEYPSFGFNIPVKHYLEILPDLLKDIRLQKIEDLQSPVFYHHSCYLSRCAHLSEIPYAILKEICGFSTIIPERYAEGTTLCCGGGGGQILVEEKISERPAALIVDKIKKHGVKRIVTSCPYCYAMLSDCSKALDPKIKVYDLLEFILPHHQEV